MLENQTRSKKNNPRTFYRYSECFKEKVIQEVSQGSSISEVFRRYDIKNITDEEVTLFEKGKPIKEIRKQIIARIMNEAYQQGGILSTRDAGLIPK